MSFTNFSSSNSILIGDLTKEDLFSKDHKFYENYLSSEPYQFKKNIDLNGISVKILFGTWCHDSQREVPRLLQLLNTLNIQENYIHLIGLNYLKNEPLDRGKSFQIRKTPTFVFLRNQKEIGRIVEMPEISLEADLLKILGPLD